MRLSPSSPSPWRMNANPFIHMSNSLFSSRSCLLHLMWWTVQGKCRHLGYIKLNNESLLEYEDFWTFSIHKKSPSNGEETSTEGEMFFSASLSIFNPYFLPACHVIVSYGRHCTDFSVHWMSSGEDKLLEVHWVCFLFKPLKKCYYGGRLI